MKEIIADLHQLTLKAVADLSTANLDDLTEDDTELIAEAVELLNDLYEELYDKVFVKLND
jgi:hypothetical protein